MELSIQWRTQENLTSTRIISDIIVLKKTKSKSRFLYYYHILFIFAYIYYEPTHTVETYRSSAPNRKKYPHKVAK